MMSRSPTLRLLGGLAVTLIAVAVFSWYSLTQLNILRKLQTDTIDRNRQDSLQLLRVQRNLNELGLALRDMTEGEDPYPLSAYKDQFERLHTDLADALQREGNLSPIGRTPAQQNLLLQSSGQFWSAVDRLFQLASQNQEKEARAMLRGPLHMQQSALTALVARLLVSNNEAEEAAAGQIQAIHNHVVSNIYYFLCAMLVLIAITSLTLIYSNRKLFAELEAMSQQRRVLASKLITVQEEVLRSVAHELHDEFGQILTAVGAMLTRAEKKGLPPDSPFRIELQEVREIAQTTLQKMRSYSQVLHPTVLDDYGLQRALEWYVQQFERQAGIDTTFEQEGDGSRISDAVSIHVYRILQEALNNVAKHSESVTASVRVQFHPDRLKLEVQDYGIGFRMKTPAGPETTSLGLIAMRERAEMLKGRLQFLSPPEGGTLVVLEIPLTPEQTTAARTGYTAHPVPERK